MKKYYSRRIDIFPPWKKVLCVILSVIIAFGTLITITFGNSRFQKWLGIKSMLSAYAAEIVDTKGAVSVDEKSMTADNHIIDLKNSDGSNTVYLFSEPISFVDENGNLKTKDISVEKQDDAELKEQGYTYTNGQNDYRINFADKSEKGLLVSYGDNSYSLSPNSVRSVDGSKSISESLNETFETFEYKNIYGNGTNLKFYPQLNGVKDEIILNKNINQSQFSFELKVKDGTASANADGSVTIKDKSGKSIQTFSAPFAYDSEYTEGDNNEHYIDCSYSLEQIDDNTYNMTVSVDEEWLNSKNTKYPVVIDPTTSELSNSADAGVYSKYKTTKYGAEQLCCFGNSNDYGYGRVYSKFTMPEAIKKGAAINSAYQWERETTARTTSTKVTAYLVTESWKEGDINWSTKKKYNSGIKSNTRTISSKSEDKSSPYWYKFNIKSLVKKWADGTANYGMAFVSSEETDKNKNWRAFAARNYSSSSMRPYTVINYTNDATAPTITGVSGNPTKWAKSATLSINGAKDNSGGVGLHSTAYSFSTEKGKYSWQSSNKKTFSAKCTVYMAVRDARNNIYNIPTAEKITKIDNTAPTFKVETTPTGWTKNKVNITILEAKDTESGLNSKPYSISTAKNTFSYSAESKKAVSKNGVYYVTVSDSLGNVKTVSVNITNIDPVAPTTPKITASTTAVTSDTVRLTVSSTDAESGVSAYSFDKGKTWQTDKYKDFDKNQTVEVCTKDKAGNISAVVAYKITNIISSDAGEIAQTPTDWTNGNVSVIVNLDANSKNNLADIPYSFDNGETWQKDNIKEFGKNQSVNVKIKYQDGTIVSKDTIEITNIDRTAPNIEIETAETDDEITITATAIDDESGVEEYSFDGGKTWVENNIFTVEKNSTDIVKVIVRDNAGNEKEQKVYITKPEFYDDGVLTGLVNPIYTSDAPMEYKIGDDGKWTDYSVPFATPIHKDVVVYARLKGSDNASEKTVKAKDSMLGKYNETVTDFSLSLNGLTFDFNHYFNYEYNVWEFGTISRVYANDNTTAHATLPDGTKLNFVRVEEDKYVNPNNNYTLTALASGAVINADDTFYFFDKSGQLVSISDKYGNSIDITVTDDTITVTDNIDRTYVLALNDIGDVASVTDPAGNTIKYSYDENYNLTKVTDQAGVIISEYEYSANGVLKKSMDKTIEYNDKGRISTLRYDSGAYVSYHYDDDNNTVTTKNSVGDTTTQVYNDALLTVSSTDEDGNTTSYSYDDRYRVIKEKSGDKTTEYTYNKGGNLVSTITADGDDKECSYFVYDDNNNLIRQQTDDDYTYYQYNSNGDMTVSATLSSDYDGDVPNIFDESLDCFDTILYTYNSNGTLSTEKSEDSVTSYEYDNYGNTVQTSTLTTDDDGNESASASAKTYDIMGNVLTSTEGENTSSYTYDKAGRTILSDENGQCTRTLYDSYGRTVQEISSEDYDSTKDGLPEQNTYSDSKAGHTYVYATNGTLTNETNRLGKTTEYSYNEFGTKSEEKFDIYNFYYNNYGDISSVKVAGKETVSYSYKDKLLWLESYANGDKIRYEYDSKDNVIAQYKNNDTQPYVTYSYDSEGELTQKVNTDTGLKYVYGTDSEVSVYRLSDNTLVQSYKEQSNDDEDITTSSETHFGVANSYVTGEKNISYTHGDNTAKYSYNTNEDDENKTVSDSVEYNGNKALNAAYTYDKDGNVLTKKYSDIQTFTNEYDEKGRISSSSYGETTVNYAYDTHGQLVSANDDTYDYDDRGNITSKTVGNTTTTFTYNTDGWKDLLVKVNDDKLTYDANGNVLTYGDKEYTWSYGRTLTGITDGENKYSYTYDENGIRTSKTVNGATTYYNTDNGTILSQSDGDNTWYFQYDTNGSPLGFVLNGIQYFYITNQMGDILAITDTEGSIVGNYEYDAWGKVLTADTDIAKQNPIRYRGYYYDNETGYYYLQSRYYDSNICRFINADIFEIAKRNNSTSTILNMFSYCFNHPVYSIDLTGYWSSDVHFGYNSNSKNHFYSTYSISNGTFYYGTYYWAYISVGFSKYFAYNIAYWCNDVDKTYTPSKLKYNHWHFNSNWGKKGKTDSRVQHRNEMLKKAKNYLSKATSKKKRKIYYKDDLSLALKYIGYALHPMQDKYAHIYNKKSKYSSYSLGNNKYSHVGVKNVDNAKVRTGDVFDTGTMTKKLLKSLYNNYAILRIKNLYVSL